MSEEYLKYNVFCQAQQLNLILQLLLIKDTCLHAGRSCCSFQLSVGRFAIHCNIALNLGNISTANITSLKVKLKSSSCILHTIITEKHVQMWWYLADSLLSTTLMLAILIQLVWLIWIAIKVRSWWAGVAYGLFILQSIYSDVGKCLVECWKPFIARMFVSDFQFPNFQLFDHIRNPMPNECIYLLESKISRSKPIDSLCRLTIRRANDTWFELSIFGFNLHFWIANSCVIKQKRIITL